MLVGRVITYGLAGKDLAFALDFMSHVPVDFLMFGRTVEYFSAQGASLIGEFFADSAREKFWFRGDREVRLSGHSDRL